MIGRSSLDELLPPQNSKFLQTGYHLILVQQSNFHASNNADPSSSKINANEAGFPTTASTTNNGAMAKVSLTTSLALMRDLQLTNGEFSHRDLIVDTPLFDLCKACSLNKCSFNTSTKCWIAAH
uniref:Uncharacterized protein n=1 Tax=Romanomermis culicivorax TaxID=13658 RepID=A0A915JQT0_ROMCU